MVITIEPGMHFYTKPMWHLLVDYVIVFSFVPPNAGLYVDLNRSIAPKEFHGLGLRIEDDILITETGVEVLTQSCPKTVAEIESIMR